MENGKPSSILTRSLNLAVIALFLAASAVPAYSDESAPAAPPATSDLANEGVPPAPSVDPGMAPADEAPPAEHAVKKRKKSGKHSAKKKSKHGKRKGAGHKKKKKHANY